MNKQNVSGGAPISKLPSLFITFISFYSVEYSTFRRLLCIICYYAYSNIYILVGLVLVWCVFFLNIFEYAIRILPMDGTQCMNACFLRVKCAPASNKDPLGSSSGLRAKCFGSLIVTVQKLMISIQNINTIWRCWVILGKKHEKLFLNIYVENWDWTSRGGGGGRVGWW